VASLYANAEVTRTLLRIQRPVSLEEAREFCQAPAAACGDHRFGAALQADGNLGTELRALLVEFAASTLGALEVRATILDDNGASARALEKLGFTVLEVGASEVDSRGDERRVTRWFLCRPSREPSGAAELQPRAGRFDTGRSA